MKINSVKKKFIRYSYLVVFLLIIHSLLNRIFFQEDFFPQFIRIAFIVVLLNLTYKGSFTAKLLLFLIGLLPSFISIILSPTLLVTINNSFIMILFILVNIINVIFIIRLLNFKL